ncbi:hypothetical protein RZS08_18840, partial [Arthrospira platensis SPKY1]|nr:hypothetical protein [Arthrospira platensis SPKY1]
MVITGFRRLGQVRLGGLTYHSPAQAVPAGCAAQSILFHLTHFTPSPVPTSSPWLEGNALGPGLRRLDAEPGHVQGRQRQPVQDRG